MPRASSNSLRVLLATSLIILVQAFLPTRWLASWTNDLAAVVNLPLAPLADASTSLRLWMRPTPEPNPDLSERERQLLLDRDEYRALWRAEQLRAEELETLLADLRLTAGLHRGGEYTPVLADVTGRSPDRVAGPVRLNVGSRQGLQPGQAAIYRGSHLVGRVADDVSRLSAWLIPIVDPAVGRMECIVLSAGSTEAPAAGRRLLVTPEGDGTFRADVDAAWEVAAGDEIILDDPAWVSGARGMTVGRVEEVRLRDDQPLRRRLVIRPDFDAHHVATVTVKVEARDGGRPPAHGGVAP